MTILYLFLPEIKLNDIALKQGGGFVYSWNLVSQNQLPFSPIKKNV
jgi:hypothetical protein